MQIKLRAQVKKAKAVAVGIAYTMSADYPVPDVMIAMNSGIEVTQKHNLVLTWDRTETRVDSIVEKRFLELSSEGRVGA